jgi:hypothetical protein
MILITDRFASIPLFLATTGRRSVRDRRAWRARRAGISADPDLEALHER